MFRKRMRMFMIYGSIIVLMLLTFCLVQPRFGYESTHSSDIPAETAIPALP